MSKLRHNAISFSAWSVTKEPATNRDVNSETRQSSRSSGPWMPRYIFTTISSSHPICLTAMLHQQVVHTTVWARNRILLVIIGEQRQQLMACMALCFERWKRRRYVPTCSVLDCFQISSTRKQSSAYQQTVRLNCRRKSSKKLCIFFVER